MKAIVEPKRRHARGKGRAVAVRIEARQLEANVAAVHEQIVRTRLWAGFLEAGMVDAPLKLVLNKYGSGGQ